MRQSRPLRPAKKGSQTQVPIPGLRVWVIIIRNESFGFYGCTPSLRCRLCGLNTRRRALDQIERRIRVGSSFNSPATKKYKPSSNKALPSAMTPPPPQTTFSAASDGQHGVLAVSPYSDFQAGKDNFIGVTWFAARNHRNLPNAPVTGYD